MAFWTKGNYNKEFTDLRKIICMRKFEFLIFQN